MDSNVVAMHVAAYLTYVFSLFLYDGFYANNIINNTDRSQHLESIANMAQTVLNMASQLILIVIFNRYSGYDKEIVVSTDHEGYVKIRTS